jgi:hypothetical protein
VRQLENPNPSENQPGPPALAANPAENPPTGAVPDLDISGDPAPTPLDPPLRGAGMTDLVFGAVLPPEWIQLALLDAAMATRTRKTARGSIVLVGVAHQLGKVLMRCFPDLGVKVGEVGWQRCAHLRHVSLYGLINAGGRHDHGLF